LISVNNKVSARTFGRERTRDKRAREAITVGCTGGRWTQGTIRSGGASNGGQKIGAAEAGGKGAFLSSSVQGNGRGGTRTGGKTSRDTKEVGITARPRVGGQRRWR